MLSARAILSPVVFAVLLAAAPCSAVSEDAVSEDAASEDVEPGALLRKAAGAADQGDSQAAVKWAEKAVAKDPKLAAAHYLLGRETFRLGEVQQSVKHFDRFVELVPQREKSLWERGISLYYAGQFRRGAKQFELYQTYHDNDVENATWRYLCVARTDGAKKARATLLPIRNDRRVPMMKIYAMYRGKTDPADVLAAAKAGEVPAAARNARLFYAHLYIGLFHEAAGDQKLAAKHIRAAAKHKIGHYMWDVARVHAARLGE